MQSSCFTRRRPGERDRPAQLICAPFSCTCIISVFKIWNPSNHAHPTHHKQQQEVATHYIWWTVWQSKCTGMNQRLRNRPLSKCLKNRLSLFGDKSLSPVRGRKVALCEKVQFELFYSLGWLRKKLTFSKQTSQARMLQIPEVFRCASAYIVATSLIMTLETFCLRGTTQLWEHMAAKSATQHSELKVQNMLAWNSTHCSAHLSHIITEDACWRGDSIISTRINRVMTLISAERWIRLCDQNLSKHGKGFERWDVWYHNTERY